MKTLRIAFLGLFAGLFFPMCLAQQFEVVNDISLPFFEGEIAWCDYDNDNDLDLIMFGTGFNEKELWVYRNDGNNTFTIQPESTYNGMDPGDMDLSDFDNDGDVDLVVSGGLSGIRTVILENSEKVYSDQNHFLDVAGSVNWVDYNNDGDEDVFLTGMFDNDIVYYSTQRMFRNEDSSQFVRASVDITGADGIAEWADFNNDGYLDVYIHGEYGNDRFGFSDGSWLYKNNGNNNFETKDFIDFSSININGVSWVDFNSDGFQDLFLYSPDSLMICKNIDGENFELQTQLTIKDRIKYHATWADYNNDGYPDLSYATSSKINFFKNINGVELLADTSISLNIYYHPYIAWADYDTDGDLDFAVNLHDKTVIYKNNSQIINSLPTKPTQLVSKPEGDKATLSWDNAIDQETPGNGISYNVYISDDTSNQTVKSSISEIETGFRKIVKIGNSGYSNFYIIKGLDTTKTYYWSVQAIDGLNAGGPFAELQTIDFSITKLNQTIVFDALPSSVDLCSSGLKLQASASSKLPVTFTSSDTSIAYILNDSLVLRNTGNVTISAIQEGDNEFYSATPVKRDLTIINSSSSSTDNITACDSYKWIDGITYFESNSIATYTLTNVQGCDSVVALDLTITNGNKGIDVISACDSFKWIDGITYTQSNNTATHTLTNARGCDSVVTLNLTINKSTSSVQNITAINSYTWIDGITYTVNNNTATHTILNSHGCDSVITLNLTITVPVEPLTVTVNAKNVQCFGESTGTAALSVVGGVAPYLYKWSNGSTTQNQTGLSAGNYIVTVSDAKESKLIKEITISEPSTLLSVSGNSDHVKCKGDATGSITLQVEGGVEPYTYKWSNGFTTKNIYQLKANNYTVTVLDSNGCTITQKYTISQPANALMVYGIPKKSDCDGDATGKITLTVSGGVQPYSYNWSNGSDEKDQTLLATGNYGVTVTDTNQCLEVWNTTISQQSKASFKGIAKYSGGFIEAGDASVFLYDVQHNMNDSIWEVRMQDNGVFEFTDIPVGQYYVYVKLDENVKQKYNDVSHTYYKQTFKWNEAKTFDLSCGDISSIVLNMVEFPASAMGTSSVSGKVVKDNKGLKSSFPPIENVDVMLINLLRNTPVASVITNEDGYYEIGEIAEGDYALYINSPGISQNSTYTFSVYKKTTSFSNMDFEIDMDENFEFNTINLAATNIESSEGQFDLITYPNPANNYVIISADYIKNKEAEITLFSNLGVVIQKQKLYAGENHTNEFKFELSNVVSGAYILKIECEKSVSIKNIIVIK